MEKLFIRCLIGLFCSSSLFAQDSLCVFDLKGTAYLKTKASLEPVRKGSFLNNSAILMLQQTDVTAIDAGGRAYQLKGSGEYPYKDLLNNKVIEKGGSLTAKYFRLIWEEFTNKSKDKTVIGGVFRGEIPMLYPPDSAMVVNRSITFKWDRIWESDLSYFFLRNKQNGELLKLATNGNSITLFRDNPIFSVGEAFEWVVSEQGFPNLNNLPFFGFSRIDRNRYEELKSSYDELISDLKQLGVSDPEIDLRLCETYGLCKE